MKYCVFLLLLAGCSNSSSWRYDAIPNGESAFESARLLYSSPASHLKLELLKLQGTVRASLFLTLHRFTASPSHSVQVTLSIDGKQFSEPIAYHEGRMRLSLSKQLTDILLFALQEGKPVAILVDGFRETISPEQFAPYYSKLLNSNTDWLKYIKGPIE